MDEIQTYRVDILEYSPERKACDAVMYDLYSHDTEGAIEYAPADNILCWGSLSLAVI